MAIFKRRKRTFGQVLVPPPAPIHPNEPSGFIAITSRDYSALNEAGWADVNGSGGITGSISIVSDATALKSPPNVGAITFPSGFTGNNTPASSSTTTIFNARRLYIDCYFKLSVSWSNHISSSIDKVWQVRMGSNPSAIRLFTYLSGSDGGATFWQVSLSGSGLPSASANLIGNFGQSQIIRNNWNRIEMIVDAGTTGSANGAISLWINSLEVAKHTGIPFLTNGDTGSITQFNWMPTHGITGGAPLIASQAQYIDSIYLSRG